MVSSDLSAAANTLSALARALKANDSQDLWHSLQLTARAVADALRVKDPDHDNHTLLGRSPLPTTLTNLLSLALHGAPVPDLAYSSAVNELLRVAANLSMDHSKSLVVSSHVSIFITLVRRKSRPSARGRISSSDFVFARVLRRSRSTASDNKARAFYRTTPQRHQIRHRRVTQLQCWLWCLFRIKYLNSRLTALA